MFEIKVRDHLFIAHSLKDDFFGEAKNLHGATYVIDLVISSEKLDEKNVVIDISLASEVLKKCIAAYNYKNLDDIQKFKNVITTTEFMSKVLVDDFIIELKKLNFNLKNITSIKATLNESHIAAASYLKILR
tara:strand:+ start:226 stop:621 length:396 start_codon:yes stop_codon:yes gene_type:complete